MKRTGIISRKTKPYIHFQLRFILSRRGGIIACRGIKLIKYAIEASFARLSAGASSLIGITQIFETAANVIIARNNINI